MNEQNNEVSSLNVDTLNDNMLADLRELVSYTKNSVTLLKEIKILSAFNKKVLNVEDLKLYTGLSEATIYNLSRKNLIPKGENTEMRKLFFEKDRIDAWLLGKPDVSDEYFEELFNEKLLKNKR
jgi:predicted DNA-binding transcriptional regulator AlpA